MGICRYAGIQRETTKKEYSFRSMAEKLLKYLEVNGDTDRQTLLKEVFYNQKWLLDLIVKELESAGIIESRYEKQQGKEEDQGK